MDEFTFLRGLFNRMLACEREAENLRSSNQLDGRTAGVREVAARAMGYDHTARELAGIIREYLQLTRSDER